MCRHDRNSATYDFLELRKLTGGGPLNAAPRPINPHASGSVTERGYSSSSSGSSRQQTIAGAIVHTVPGSQVSAAAGSGARTTRYRPVLKNKAATRRVGGGVASGKSRGQKPGSGTTSAGRSAPRVSSIGSSDSGAETLHEPSNSRAPSRVSHNVQVSTRVRVKPMIAPAKSSFTKPPITPRTFLEDTGNSRSAKVSAERVRSRDTRKSSDTHVTEVSDMSQENLHEDSEPQHHLPTQTNSHIATATQNSNKTDRSHSHSRHRDIIQSATEQLNSLALHVDPRAGSVGTSRATSRAASCVGGSSRPPTGGSSSSRSGASNSPAQRRASQERMKTTIRAFLSRTVDPNDSSHVRATPSDLNSRTLDPSQLESFSRSTSKSRPLSCSSQSSQINPNSRISRYRVSPGGVRPTSVSDSLAHTYTASSSTRYRKYSHGGVSSGSSTYRSSAAPAIGFAKGGEHRHKKVPPNFGEWLNSQQLLLVLMWFGGGGL